MARERKVALKKIGTMGFLGNEIAERPMKLVPAGSQFPIPQSRRNLARIEERALQVGAQPKINRASSRARADGIKNIGRPAANVCGRRYPT